jgi:inosine-uridine nucleoside N-ribohydrolase
MAETALIVSSNPTPRSVEMIAAANAYYGLPGIPLASGGEDAKFANDVNGFCEKTFAASGLDRKSLEIDKAVPALRKALSKAPDRSVRMVATGFSTNLAALLESGPDNGDDGVKLDGRELVARKAEFLSIMAADFHSSNKNAKGEAEAEYNIKGDINAARELFAKWPTPVFVSDFSTGLRVLSDWKTLDVQLKDSNPVKIAYASFFKGTPVERPSWDQTSMLFALEPDAGHFALSKPGEVEIGDDGLSRFEERADGLHRLLLFDTERNPERVNETLHARFYREA